MHYLFARVLVNHGLSSLSRLSCNSKCLHLLTYKTGLGGFEKMVARVHFTNQSLSLSWFLPWINTSTVRSICQGTTEGLKKVLGVFPLSVLIFFSVHFFQLLWLLLPYYALDISTWFHEVKNRSNFLGNLAKDKTVLFCG